VTKNSLSLLLSLIITRLEIKINLKWK